MDFGERQGFEAADAQASGLLDAPVQAALPDIPELSPPPPGSLPPAPVVFAFNLRAATAIAFSGAVHAGALGLFIFLAPPVNEQPEVQEIPIEVVAEAPPEQLPEVAVQPEPSPQEPEAAAPAKAEPPPVVAEAQPEPPVAELSSEPEPVMAAVAVEPEPVVTIEPETQVAALAPPLTEPPPLIPAPEIIPPPTVAIPRAAPAKADAPKREEPRRPPPKREVEERRPEPRRIVEERKPTPKPVAARPAPERPIERVRTAAPPPAAARPPAPAPSSVAISAWKSSVHGRIRIEYPGVPEARGRTGAIVLTFGTGGHFAGVSLSRPTGHAGLDAAALTSARRATFPPAPPGATRALIIPFRF